MQIDDKKFPSSPITYLVFRMAASLAHFILTSVVNLIEYVADTRFYQSDSIRNIQSTRKFRKTDIKNLNTCSANYDLIFNGDKTLSVYSRLKEQPMTEVT